MAMFSAGELTDENVIHDTIEHFRRINGVGRKKFDAHLKEETALWRQRNALEWEVDWGAFEEEVNEANKKRAMTANTKTEKDECFDVEPEDYVPKSCHKCHAVGSLTSIVCNTADMSEAEEADYMAGNWGIARCRACGVEVPWGF